MMKNASLLALAVAIGSSSCSSELTVRSIKQPLAEGRQPAAFRLAEGVSQLTLGNVGLALKAFCSWMSCRNSRSKHSMHCGNRSKPGRC